MTQLATRQVAEAGTQSGWTKEQVELIKSMCVSASATNDEFEVMLYMARKYGLDPLTKQIYMQKYRDSSKPGGYAPATIMVSYAGMQEIANRSDMLDGISAEPIFNDKGILIGAKSTLWKRGHSHPFMKTVYLEEYLQKKDGKPMGLWGSKPITMICKVADAQNYRQAFSLGQMYTEEEMPMQEALQPAPQPKQEVVDRSTGEVIEAPVVPKAAEAPKEKRSKKLDLEEVRQRIKVDAEFGKLDIAETVSNKDSSFLPITLDQFNWAVNKMTGCAASMDAIKKYGIEGSLQDAVKVRYKGEGLKWAQEMSAGLHILWEKEQEYQEESQKEGDIPSPEAEQQDTSEFGF